MRALHGVRGVVRPLFLGFAASTLALAGSALAGSALAGSAVAADVTLRQIMQDPDWIGPPVEAAWWQYGDDAYVYRVKRADTTVRDHYRRNISAEDDALLDTTVLGTIDGDSQVASRDGQKVISVLEGSLLLRDRRSGALRRLYTGPEPVTRMQFAADESSVQFLVDGRWWQVPLVGGAAWPVADLRFEDAPHATGDDALEQEQLRLFTTLERERRHDADEHAAAVARATAVPGLGAAPWYLGAGQEAVDSALSADGRWLLVAVRDAAGNGAEAGGKADAMPHYVARSGYVDIEDVRTLVGRDAPRPESVWLLDLAMREKHPVALTALTGRDRDPLARLKREQDITPHDGDDLRPLTIEAMAWHPEQAQALLQLRSIDNKDRWTLRLDAPSQRAREIHHQHDDAWINPYQFNELGWVPGSDVAWLLSEESGYGHLYTVDARGRIRQHTRGDFEVTAVQFSRDGGSAFFIANLGNATEYDLYRLDLASGDPERLTTLRGVESYALHADGQRALLRWSSSYTPPQAAVLALTDGTVSATTDTRTPAYRALTWQAPAIVAVPSTHGRAPIWTKFYAARGEHAGPRPVVVFVHGAGYTQNTHQRWPYYFREQMFHNLLTARGYHVIDMDYRASEGYGRAWRTAIYRQMGTPELEDLVDGVNWVVREHGGDAARVGIYGGSYGGFMTLMAMFRAPEVFAAGASLRPVTDWRHYNHGYTANILNTPQVDPEAHRVSSPIEYAEGLAGHLLISHGMLDDNVFYKDSVRLIQRLIELEKEHWELASYPLEPHGFVHPESWLDQYRRILALFETTIGDTR